MSTASSLSHRKNKSQSEQSSFPGPVVGLGPLFGSCPDLGITSEEQQQFPNPNPNPADVEANNPQAPLNNQQNPPQPPPPPRRSLFARFFVPKLSQDFEGERFIEYRTTSTRKNDFWWKFFKICFVIGMGGFFLSLYLGITYIFAAQWKSPQTSFAFRNPTANRFVPFFGVLFLLIYIAWVFLKYLKTDHFLFSIRKVYIGFLSFDLIPFPRFLKAAIVTVYGLLDFPQMLGDWSDLFFVWSVVFYCLASISMLKLFEHEHHEASSVILEFSINLVSPFIVQFYRAFFKTSYHLAYLNFSVFFIVLMFALFAKYWLNFFIYRPHVAGDPYSPPSPPPDLVGPPM